MPTLEQMPVIALGLRRHADWMRRLAEDISIGKFVPRNEYDRKLSLGFWTTSKAGNLYWRRFSRVASARAYFSRMAGMIAKAEELELMASTGARLSLLGTSAPFFGVAA